METTYIFGHKVPDTDTTCASISLSYLKNKLGYKTEPRIIGDLNKETKFVLNHFNIKEPEFLNDVKVRVTDMHYNHNAMVEEHISIFKTYQKIMDLGVTGLPLVNQKKHLTGYVNLKEISRYLVEGDITELNTSYDNIIETLEGQEILKFEDEIIAILKNKIPNIIIDCNNKTVLDGKEIDIYLPEYKIGIEFNGDYWHSDLQENYQDHNGRSLTHQNKSLLAESKGVFLFHILFFHF